MTLLSLLYEKKKTQQPLLKEKFQFQGTVKPFVQVFRQQRLSALRLGSTLKLFNIIFAPLDQEQ
jgi:hypothetical protein